MKLTDLLHKEPVTCEPETPLRDVIHMMRENDVGSVVVTRGDRVLGIFTEKDLVRALDEGATLDQPVSQYMTPNPVTAHPDEGVESALQKMLRHGIRHLPIVTSDKRIVGVLSIRDLIETILEAATPL